MATADSSPRTPVFTLVAGEASGDALGAGLIEALRQRYPGARFVGVTGPRMRAAGCETLADGQQLALFGFSEVVARIPSLLRLRARLLRQIGALAPAVFIGIDAPAFNTGLETALRRRGVRVVHYVCPTAWAWRPGRTRAMARAADRYLAIFPFEPDFFAARGVAAIYVGHPLADRAQPHADQRAARAALGLCADQPLVALLPGSRHSEVRRLGPRFIAAARALAGSRPELGFAAAMASPALAERFDAQLGARGRLQSLRLIDGRARELVQAADVVLTASGTATLETLLAGRPMVVAYIVSAANYALARALRLVRVEHVAMPNLIAGRALVPELIQGAASSPVLAANVARLLDDDTARAAQTDAFASLRERLACGADRRAAAAVAELVDAR